MEARRRLLMQNRSSYVADGLVLNLDGLNRGGRTGLWVDRIAGNVCTLIGDCVEIDNGVTFNGNTENTQYGVFDELVQIDKDIGTVEWVIRLDSRNNTGRPVLSMGNLMMGGSIASDTANSGNPVMRYYCDANNGMDFYKFDDVSSASTLVYIMSGSSERAMCNGTLGSKRTVTSWPSTQVGGRLASRGQGNPFQGTIYAVRLYNRHLTEAEMLHNQRLDNKRFRLGLDI